MILRNASRAVCACVRVCVCVCMQSYLVSSSISSTLRCGSYEGRLRRSLPTSTASRPAVRARGVCGTWRDTDVITCEHKQPSSTTCATSCKLKRGCGAMADTCLIHTHSASEQQQGMDNVHTGHARVLRSIRPAHLNKPLSARPQELSDQVP